MAEGAEDQIGTPDEILERLKKEGFDTLDALIASMRATSAERDKFKADNDEARTNIRTKGGEIAELKRKVEEITAKPPEEPEPTSDKGGTAEKELAEIVSKMTDEQWEAADELLKTIDEMPDKTPEEKNALKRELVDNPEHRVTVLKEIVAGTQKAPITFRRQKKVVADPADEVAALFSSWKKRMGLLPPGPTSSPTSTRGGPPKEPERPVDTRVR